MKLLQITLLLAFYTGLGPAFTDKVVTSLPSYLVLLYIVLVICLLIGGEPTYFNMNVLYRIFNVILKISF